MKPTLYPRQKYDESSAQFNQLCSVHTPQDQPNPGLHVVKWTLGHHHEKYEIALAKVICCENGLDIHPGQCWALDSPICLEAFKAAAEHSYQQALDCLSYSVVQHILKLQKLGLPGTCRYSQPLLQILTGFCGLGYKQQKKIAAGLKKHSRAVNMALSDYNKQAECLGHPILDFQWVIEYSFLSNFELLHQTHNVISKQP